MDVRRMARLVAPVFLVASMAFIATCARAENAPPGGSWTIEKVEAGNAELLLSARTDHGSWEEGRTISLADLRGVSGAQIAGTGDVRFSIVRDAGSFVCAGYMSNGRGGGTFTYEPSATFARELERRGLQPPTPMQQFSFTMNGLSIAYVDTLLKAGYRPTTDELQRMYDHGVNERYVTELASLGYRPGSIEDLVRMRDHGVDPSYIKELRQNGISGISADDLVVLRDHGVTPEYVAGLHALGYTPSAREITRLRDHGVSISYIQHLRSRGYHPSVDELIRLRDAGV